MKAEPLPAPNESPDATEALLQALIAQCHQIIREVVVPHAEAAQTINDRLRYLDQVSHLVRNATAIGDTVARLRGGTTQETRQRIVVERIEKSAALLDIPKAIQAATRRTYPPADKPGEGVG